MEDKKHRKKQILKYRKITEQALTLWNLLFRAVSLYCTVNTVNTCLSSSKSRHLGAQKTQVLV